MTIHVTLDESERQLTILALALASLARPGWEDALERVSHKLLGDAMFQEFRHVNVLENSPDPLAVRPVIDILIARLEKR